MSKHRNATAERHADDREDDDDEDTTSVASSRAGTPARTKDRRMTASTHWLFQTGLYKRNQGRVTRQATFGSLAGGLGIGCWRLSQVLMGQPRLVQIGIPLVIFAVGVWIVYRLVNMPRFADFLIGVEAEMAKVSWPTRHELIRSSIVVIVTIIGLAAILFAFDSFWIALFRLLRVTSG
jgi:preprotein translocase subunit SecE